MNNLNSKNVQISLSLFKQTIDLLGYWNISDSDYALKSDYENVLNAFLAKQETLNLRQAYSKLVYAKDDDARHNARMKYLQQKRSL